MLEESQNSNYSSKYLNDLKSTPLRSEGIPRISKMFKTILSFKQTIYTVKLNRFKNYSTTLGK